MRPVEEDPRPLVSLEELPGDDPEELDPGEPGELAPPEEGSVEF